MNKDIIEQAVHHFGPKNQISKAIEEMSELTAELARFQNDKGMNVNIIEEIADVCIMVEQLKFIFGEELVNCHIGTKTRRLTLLMEDTKSKVG